MTRRSFSRARRRAVSRRLVSERLEPRLVLATFQDDISPGQQQTLLDGLAAVESWAEEVSSYAEMTQRLPGTGQSLGASLDFAALVADRIVQPVEDYFAADATPTTNELLAALDGLDFSSGGWTIDVPTASVEGGLLVEQGASRLEFAFDFSAARQFQTPLSFGPGADRWAVAFESQVPATAQLTGGWTFGIDLAAGLAPAEAFYLQLDGSAAQLSVAAPAVAGGEMNVGFFDAELTGASAQVVATLDVSLLNPDNDGGGRTTQAELTQTALPQLVSLAPSGSATLAATLEPAAFPVSGFNAPGPATLSLTGVDPFAAAVPQTNAAFDALLPFTNVSSYSTVGTLQQLGVWLNELAERGLTEELPLAEESELGELLDLGQALETGLLSALTDSGGAATFDSIQELAGVLESSLGMAPGAINVQFDGPAEELSFHVDLSATLAQTTLPLDIGLDLAPIASFSTDAELTANVEADLSFTLGFDLSPLSATLTAAAAPTGFTLSEDAAFSLELGADPVPVVVDDAATTDNTTLADLVADINAALAAAGLSDVTTGQTGDGRLTFTAAGNAVLATLQFDAAAGSPAVTDWNFTPGASASDSVLAHAFFKDIAATATATLAADDVEAAAQLGFLTLGVEDGSAEVDLDVQLAVQDPVTQTPGARLTLPQLFEHLVQDPTALIAGPTLGGSLDAEFPLTVDILGFQPPTAPKLLISWTDLTAGSPTVQLVNANDLAAFEKVDGNSFAGVLAAVADLLVEIEQLTGLGSEIPGLSDTLADIAGYAAEFRDFADAFHEDPAEALPQLETRLEEIFGIADNDLQLSWDNNAKLLRVDLLLATATTGQTTIDLDLPVGSLVDVTGTGAIAAGVGVEFELDFALDLTDPQNPEPLLLDSTELRFEAEVRGTQLDFAAALGPLGVFIDGGSLTLDRDGNPATPNDKAAIMVSLTDDEPQPDGQIPLSELDISQVSVAVDGELTATLPTFFPTENLFQGNITLSADLADPLGTLQLNTPTFDVSPGGFDLFNNLHVVVVGLDTLLGGVQDVLAGEVFGVELPLIGDNLADAATFVADFRTDVLGELQQRFAQANNQTPTVIRQALFDALGPTGLAILQDRDNSGGVTLDDVGMTLGDENMDGRPDDRVDFELELARQFTLVNTPIGFDVGLPALGLEVDGNAELLLGFAWDLHFGISREYGFFIETSAEPEIEVGIEARLPDFTAEGRLGFLQVDVADEDADGNPLTTGDLDGDGTLPSRFVAGLAIDLHDPVEDAGDPNDDELLRFDELTAGGFDFAEVIDARLDGAADLNLDIVVNFDGDARFPSLAADLRVDWMFDDDDDPQEESAEDLRGEQPEVRFENVRIDVGSFLDDFAGPIGRAISDLTAPLDPVLDFLDSPLPLLEEFGIDKSPLELADDLGIAEAEFLQVIVGLRSALADQPEVGSLVIEIGDFSLGDVDAREEEDLENADPDSDDLQDDPTDQLDGDDEQEEEARDFLDALRDVGIRLPLVEDPATAFRLLMGQNIDLVLFDPGALRVLFPMPPIKIGPLIPPVPLFASFGGFVSAELDLAFGFDTHGLRKFEQSGDFFDVFAGLFISDREQPDGTGPDVPEATLTGGLTAAAELNLVVASAGVEGGVFTNIYADLVDPNEDGRVHADEFLANLDLGLHCTFATSGDLRARLDAFVDPLVGDKQTFTIAEAVLAEYTLTDGQCYVDRFSGNDQQTAATDLGIGPGLHVDGLSIETVGDVDWYRVELLRPDSVVVDLRHSFAKGDLDLEIYDAGGALLAESRTSEDREDVTLDLPAGEFFIRVAGERNNYQLGVEPSDASATRVIYVNPAGREDRSQSYYTLAPGDDSQDGLHPERPLATVGEVLARYDLGAEDLVAIDTGFYGDPLTLTAEDEGAAFAGSVAGSTLGPLVIDAATGNRFHRLGFVGTPANVTLDNAHDQWFDRATFSGAGDGLRILGDSSDNRLIDSELSNGGVAVHIASAAVNTIHNNVIRGPGGIGVELLAGAATDLVGNDIHGRTVGLAAESRVATVETNLVHGNLVGVRAGRGHVGPGNEIFANDTGVLFPETAAGATLRQSTVRDNAVGIDARGDGLRIVGNAIFDNDLGVRTSTVFGPSGWSDPAAVDLTNRVRDNLVGVEVLDAGELRFTRVYANDTGVRVIGGDALGGGWVHHNLVYDNATVGILLADSQGARIESNTVYAPAGDGLQLMAATEATVRHNLVQVLAGFALSVAADSQFGYESDWNNLYASATGQVAWQGRAFDDLLDWQLEANQDHHSLGATRIDPLRDAPLFVDPMAGDFRLQPGSTSIDAGDPAADFAHEPSENGGRRNLGAYGDTPLATVSPASWLEITAPRLYVDLVPSQTYEIAWLAHNVSGLLDIDLIEMGVGKVADLGTVSVADGEFSWTPAAFVAGDNARRYRLDTTTSDGTNLTASTREAFAIVDLDPSAANGFYVNDGATDNDQFTTTLGDNRQTGLSPAAPKAGLRPLLASYALAAGDEVWTDAGNYVLAENVVLAGQAQPGEPRLATASGATLRGAGRDLTQFERANPHAEARAFELIAAPGMTLTGLSARGAEIGLLARDGSHDLTLADVASRDQTLDGVRIVAGSHDADLSDLTLTDNGRDGLFVESRLTRLADSALSDNARHGGTLREVGAAAVEGNIVRGNAVGLDIINSLPAETRIGDDDLAAEQGNQIHDNVSGGLFASGRVLVAGNRVSENGPFGLRLDDGAAAIRNVVRQHEVGIDASGSSSLIHENRVMAHASDGVRASYDSDLRFNAIYSSGRSGIRVDRFSGSIEHNVVYASGQTGIDVAGPGRGAELLHNTVYEPCGLNPDSPTAPTEIAFTWSWNLDLTRIVPNKALPTIPVQGQARLRFQPPIGLNFGDSFPLGPGGGPGAETPIPLPEFDTFQIDFELVALDLTNDGMDSPLGPISVSLGSQPSRGSLILDNVGGALVGSMLMELNLTLVVPELGRVLGSGEPLIVASEIPPTSGIDPHAALQIPLTFAAAQPGFLFDLERSPTAPPWAELIIGGAAASSPKLPYTGGGGCGEIGVHLHNQAEYATLRNNAIYVEGNGGRVTTPGGFNLVVAADSARGFDSDFNSLTTTHGAIGSWAGQPAPTLEQWRMLADDDWRSIAPSPEHVWIDPDGLDGVLGFASPGAGDGRDDNLHLQSPHGQVASGDLAPVEDLASGLPRFEPVLFESDLGDELSPGVDAGDPALPFTGETTENGRVANVGAYGNTPQAARTAPESLHVVWPLGHEQLVRGRSYELAWRSHDAAGTVDIRLGEVDPLGNLTNLQTLFTATPNDGAETWTVPAGVASATNYVIQIERNDGIQGESRGPFAIEADNRPPTILQATPSLVEREGRSQNTLSALELTFNEDVSAADLPSSYELREAGPNAALGDGDDTLIPVTPLYVPPPTDERTANVILTPATPLGPGRYQLTAFAAIADAAGLALAGGDYVRTFVVDQAPPTLTLPPVAPLFRNTPLPSLPIQFSEPVREFGLADLRLTRGGGPNLLTGGQTLSSTNEAAWLLDQLADLTTADGEYRFEVLASGTGILDIAGNPLAASDFIVWRMDTLAPRVRIDTVAPDPRTGGVDEITIRFSEPVSGFDLSDLTLTRDGGPDRLGPGQSLVQDNPTTYRVTGLASLTNGPGVYQLLIDPLTAGVVDAAGNPLVDGDREIWERETAAGFDFALSGPTEVLRGEELAFSLTATAGLAPLEYEIDWGDGQTETLLGQPGAVVAQHVFAATGVYTLSVTARDAAGREASDTLLVSVTAIREVDGELRIAGSEEDDLIRVSQRGDELFVQIGRDRLAPLAKPERLRITGGPGRDRIQAVGLDIPVEIHGGPGDDYLFGGEGDDLLVGGDGHDRLYGGAGDDLLDGGPGRDRLLGGRGNDVLSGGDDRDLLLGEDGDDLLLGGRGGDIVYGGDGNDLLSGVATTLDQPTGDTPAEITAYHDALLAALAQWGSSRDDSSLLPWSDDQARDRLLGGAGSDRFLESRDSLRDFDPLEDERA